MVWGERKKCEEKEGEVERLEERKD